MTCVFLLESLKHNIIPKIPLILQNKRELASANSPIVVLKSQVSEKIGEIIGEIEKWLEVLK